MIELSSSVPHSIPDHSTGQPKLIQSPKLEVVFNYIFTLSRPIGIHEYDRFINFRGSALSKNLAEHHPVFAKDSRDIFEPGTASHSFQSARLQIHLMPLLDPYLMQILLNKAQAAPSR